jgi:diketogulonate reductase-like aldo/keto reductase
MKKWLFCLFFLTGGYMNLHALLDSVAVDVERGMCKIDGMDYPIIGFGTYPLTDKVCITAVGQAIKAGYRIIDTATYYENFDSISEALKHQDRSSYYIISKVGPDSQSAEDLCEDLAVTLKQLQTNYLDAYLLHWPNSRIPIEETLTTIEMLRRENKIRHIGLSNVTVNHLTRALAIGIPITWVQIEMHPYFLDGELLNFCKNHSIVVQAWRPLDLGHVREDAVLTEIGKKYGKTACQVAISTKILMS